MLRDLDFNFSFFSSVGGFKSVFVPGFIVIQDCLRKQSFVTIITAIKGLYAPSKSCKRE